MPIRLKKGFKDFMTKKSQDRREPEDLMLHQNTMTSFQLTHSSVRGRFVRLNSLCHDILSRHHYPHIINHTLRELIPVAIALAGAFKFEGVFTLQIQGALSGGDQNSQQAPVKFMVVDVDHKGAVRACAHFDEEAIKTLGASAPLFSLFGNGYLAYTIDQGDNTDRYQGIVELRGNTLAECLQHYFRQSDQLETSFYVTSDNIQATCVMLQKLPFDREKEAETYDEWFRANALLSTLKKDEALGEIAAHDVLHRLFWQEGLEVFDTRGFIFHCRCSKEKIEGVLKTLSSEDHSDMEKNGVITISCDYCSEVYVFSSRH